MSHGPLSLLHHNMLDCVTVMMHCIRQEASVLAKQVSCVFTTEESRAKIWL